jgi:hypothetical protein
MPRVIRQTCTDHCGSCGRHFHGLAAFDCHLVGGECQDPDGVENTKGRKLLRAWTEDGHCELSPGCAVDGQIVKSIHPVCIWQLIPDPRAEAWLQNLTAVSETSSMPKPE